MRVSGIWGFGGVHFVPKRSIQIAENAENGQARFFHRRRGQQIACDFAGSYQHQILILMQLATPIALTSHISHLFSCLVSRRV